MRHRKKRSRLSMMGSRRKATIKNMVGSLLKYQKIEMIHGRAKVVRSHAEKLITLAKSDTVASRRRAFDVLQDRDLVGLLFNEIVPLFKDRTSGFTRIIPLGFRRGDGAAMAIIELTDKSIKEKAVKKIKEKNSAKIVEAEEIEKSSASEKEAAHDDHAHKHSGKGKQTLEEEKRMEKGKSEEKKMTSKKGFIKNVQGLFRKRGDR